MRTCLGRLVPMVALATLTFSAQPASAQLGFTIDPTQGFPGDTVNGQVDPATVAATCTATVEGLQETFIALLEGPLLAGNTEGELPQRFFPDPSNIVYENTKQLSYALNLLVMLGIANNLNGAAEGALPQTFVMTFADILTQQPLGQIGNFDMTTGVGSVVVPDLAPGVYPVVATCVSPTFDIDALEQAIIQGGNFLTSIGATFGPEGPFSEQFLAFMKHFLDTDLEGLELVFEFVNAIGPTLLQPMMVPARPDCSSTRSCRRRRSTFGPPTSGARAAGPAASSSTAACRRGSSGPTTRSCRRPTSPSVSSTASTST